MKQIYLSLIAILTVASMSAQNASPNLESFEGLVGELPSCWTVIDADGDSENWESFEDGATWPANTGEGIMRSASWIYPSALTPDNYLILPQLDIQAGENLTYYVAGQDPSYSLEKYAVVLSTTGTDAADFTVSLFEETLANEVWDVRDVDLSNYVGQQVYIAFRHYDVTDQFYIKMDDVQFPTTVDAACAVVTNLDENEVSAIEMYPNPVNDVLFINNDGSQNSQVQVLNNMGQVVYAESFLASAQIQVNLSTLAAGIYTVRMTADNAVSQGTVVVK